jgi:hypothetical protein
MQGDAGNDQVHGGLGFDTIDGGADFDDCYDTVGAVDGADMTSCEDEHVTPAPPLPEAAG